VTTPCFVAISLLNAEVAAKLVLPVPGPLSKISSESVTDPQLVKVDHALRAPNGISRVVREYAEHLTHGFSLPSSPPSDIRCQPCPGRGICPGLAAS